ncbi:hypothetical protein [Methylocapsa palsarum]|uniref:Uncharacterized protein n=1 Tax=Methylocapsa palsarum TaxID=1612308 RepID=A0A1I4CD94_9HYPH|nr:hypothetical protein [Methylocapsa palsarum]SFK79124.1 hypothetical protein SAMN05444581_12118 [Methylocapsa palsarum]
MFKTRYEIEAYNAGVQAALDHAKIVAKALSADPSWKPTRIPFAADALDEFAEAGSLLLLPLPPKASSPAGTDPPSLSPSPAATANSISSPSPAKVNM